MCVCVSRHAHVRVRRYGGGREMGLGECAGLDPSVLIGTLRNLDFTLKSKGECVKGFYRGKGMARLML